MRDLDIVQHYLDQHYRIITWKAPLDKPDMKGPKESGWTEKIYTLDDYSEGKRVGLLLGVEVEPGKFLHDIDIDWSEGGLIAAKLLPPTGMVFGRLSKKISHCFYTLTTPLPTFQYKDLDNSTTLLELRGTKQDGTLGFQSMVPPSVWTKDGQSEILTFIRNDGAAHYEAKFLQQRVCLIAISLLLAKHLGHNGFGHEPRLAWAGFLLRAGIDEQDVIDMGEAMSVYCNNVEIDDVKRVVQSTAAALKLDGKKVKGGPAFAKILGEQGKLIISKINEWLGNNSDFIRGKDGCIIKDCEENILRAFTILDVTLAYNEFADRPLLNSHPLEDRQANSLYLRLERECHFRPSYQYFERVIQEASYTRSFHPVKQYLESLTWDGVSRIESWLHDYAGAMDSRYLRAVSAIVLIAAVRRIRHPGCKYDEMLVLEGAQGIQKSSALRALCPNPDWFSDDLPLNVEAKVIIERTLGKWIIEASELAGKRKADTEHLKAMLSRPVDGPARMAYARFPIERARHFIIVGTTNSSDYLADATGARRYWPVPVSHFDVKGIERDRDQLWAEACSREIAGESIRLPEHLWSEAGAHQDERQYEDLWQEIISGLLNNRKTDNFGALRVTTNEICEALGLGVERRDRIVTTRIADVMKRLDFLRTTMRSENGQVVRGYIKHRSKVGQQSLL